MLASCTLLLGLQHLGPPDGQRYSRRTFAKGSLRGAVAGAALGWLPSRRAAEAVLPVAEVAALQAAESYSVVTDSTMRLSPSVKLLTSGAVVEDLIGKRAVYLGEHHNSAADHLLQAGLIRELHAKRPRGAPMVVGLEAVQRRFQPALDDYIAGRIGEEELEAATDWRRRWFWPFAGYAPVFRACRELGIPLLALNVDSEDLSRVEVEGLPGLPREKLQQYIPDGDGFGAFASTTAFKEYVAFIIKPSYAMHERMGILKQTITGQKLAEDMSFRNFFSGRILWDEAMGTASAAWCATNPSGLLVGLVGSDHVKFACGVPARCARMTGGLGGVASVMLNPLPADTVSDPSTGTLPDGTQLLRRGRAGFGNDFSRGPDGKVNFGDYVLQLRFAPVSGDAGPPISGSSPEDRERAAAVSQARTGSSVLPLAEYLMFTSAPPISAYQGKERGPPPAAAA